MKCLLVGFGEVGKGIYETYSRYHDIDVYDTNRPDVLPQSREYDILLVAFPWREDFVPLVKAYADVYGCKDIIVFSSVQVGTCDQLGATHCPVEGKHPDLGQSICAFPKWVGGGNPKTIQFFTDAGFNFRMLPSAKHTEFLKLRSTTLYGLNIEFARYTQNVCKDIGLDFRMVQQYDEDVNEFHERMGQGWAKRYILSPPDGSKGGHCVTPNAKILNAQYPDALVARVAEQDLGNLGATVV